MNCLIRVNAYPLLGNGHLMRCLTVAKIAKQQGLTPHLVIADYPGAPLNIIDAAHCEYTLFPIMDEHADAQKFCSLLKAQSSPCKVVVDVYAFSALWHQQVYTHCCGLLVIDDLANRQYYCDALIDQSPGRIAKDYAPWVNAQAQIYLGVTHSLIAADFFSQVEQARAVRQEYFAYRKKPKLLVSLGGTDVNNLTLIWLELLANYADEFACISFVLAANAPVIAALTVKINQYVNSACPIRLWVNCKDMPKLIIEHDIALGGAGVSALERAALGMPSLLLTLADNQQYQAQILSDLGCVYYLGDWQQVPSDDIAQACLNTLLAVVRDYPLCSSLSERAFALLNVQQPYSALRTFFSAAYRS